MRGWRGGLVALGVAVLVVGHSCARPRRCEAEPPPPARWVRSPRNPIARPGFTHPDGRRELGIADPCVTYDRDDRRWKAWWTTSLGQPDQPDAQVVIKYAESQDGFAWDVQAEPAFACRRSPRDWDYSCTEAISVVKVPTGPAERRYRMYYSGRNDQATGDPRWYQIGLATSPDGRSFTRLPAAESPYAKARAPFDRVDGLVLHGRDMFPGVAGVADGVVAEPEVLLVGQTFHLWCSSYGVDARKGPLAWGVSHATSSDGIRWTPDRENPLPTLKRAGVGGSSPSVLHDEATGVFDLWLNNDSDEERARIPVMFFPSLGSWHATSRDGARWSDPYAGGRDFEWRPSAPPEAHGLLVGAKAARGPDGDRLYYVAFGGVDVPRGFLAPTRDGFVSSVLTLQVATRPPR